MQINKERKKERKKSTEIYVYLNNNKQIAITLSYIIYFILLFKVKCYQPTRKERKMSLKINLN